MPLDRSEQFGDFVRGPDGVDRPIFGSHVKHQVTDTGRVNSTSGEIEVVNDCGCFGRIGGFCELCQQEYSGGLCCYQCFHRCSDSACGRGICLAHSVEIEEPLGVIRRLCKPCHKEYERQERRRRVLRIIFIPITFPFRVMVWLFFYIHPNEIERLPRQQVLRHPFKATLPRHLSFENSRSQPPQRKPQQDRRGNNETK